VDVINYPSAGTNNNLVDPVETAFRNAAARRFRRSQAGNSGLMGKQWRTPAGSPPWPPARTTAV
jgi:hypothetical protein